MSRTFPLPFLRLSIISTSNKVTLPVFVATMVYLIKSPASITPSLLLTNSADFSTTIFGVAVINVSVGSPITVVVDGSSLSTGADRLLASAVATFESPPASTMSWSMM